MQIISLKKSAYFLFHIRKEIVIILFFLIMVGALYGKGQYAYVANSSSGTVTIVDLTDYTTSDIYVGDNPYYIKKIPGFEQLWISDPNYYRVKAYDITSGTMSFNVSLNYCKELVPSPNGKLIYAAFQDYPAQIKVYSTSNFAEIYSYSLTINNIDDINLSPEGDILYVLYDNYFYSVNPTNGNIIASTGLDYNAARMIISPYGDYAYLYDDNYYIQKIDLRTLSVTSSYIGNQVFSLAISPNGQRLYAGFYSSGTVIVYDAENLSQVSTLDVGSSRVMDLRISNKGDELFVLHRDTPNFQVFNIPDGAQLASISTGSYSYRFDFEVSQDSIPPQPITNLKPSEIYHDEALLTWIAASDDSLTESVTEYDVRYDTVAITNPDSARVYEQSIEPSPPGEVDSLLMSGLHPETDYWIAIRTIDEAGNLSEPAFFQFKTLKAPAITVSPSSLDFTVAIGDTATESITITNSAGEGGGALKYMLDITGEEGIEQFAYVANSGSGTVTVIDFEEGTKNDLYIGNYPYDVKKCPLNNDLWITDTDYYYLKVVDGLTGTIKMQTSLSYLRKVIMSPDGAFAYALYDDYPVRVRVFNTTTLAEVNNFNISSTSYIDDAAISHDGQRLYLLYNSNFSIVNAANGSAIYSFSLDGYAERVLISPDGSSAYFYGDSNYLQRVNLQTYGKTSNYLSNEIYALAASPDGQKLYAGFYSDYVIRIYSSSTLQQISTIPVNSGYLTDLRAASDDKKLYVLHRSNPNLEIYNIPNGNLLASYNTGSYSYRFDLSGSIFPFVELDPKSGEVAGGEGEQISVIIDSKNLNHRTYHANLGVECNDPNNSIFTLPLTINAQDTKGPDFNMTFFQNPYLSQYLRVIIFAHEYLTEVPRFTVDSDSIALTVQDSTYYIYMGKYQLTESGDFTFQVSGIDSLGNLGSFERTLSAANIQSGKSAIVDNASRNIHIEFRAGSFDEEVFVTIWEEENTNSDEESYGRIYHVGPEQMALSETALLEISYANIENDNYSPLNLCIYRERSDGTWEKIVSKVDRDKKAIVGNVDQLGSFKLIYDPSSQSEEILPVPDHYSLNQNYPNPFNPTTTIEYGLPQPEFVTLKIYDLLGREVMTLIKEKQKAGEHRVSFDAGSLASGVYVYRLKAGEFIKSHKMILLR